MTTHKTGLEDDTELAEIDAMIDAGIKEVDLYEIGLEDCIGRRELRQFLRAALAAKINKENEQ